ncbi:N-acetyltransferase [Paenibacillus sp. S150]|uniref:GNAT family N-acetyltransferase n=1 Tax=Paenibacillus sp. S150 TaxID=2749826 RepID=UPI001C55D246|nr:GNAT family N-acetyltransferase [Paenibacillus sp. S150]MBW4080697.1 GNAT family N-acetyltransferase [Paenibacillus sp. S150]
MTLEFMTYDEWDDALWARLEPLYREAFPHGAKPVNILHAMLDKKIAWLHTGYQDGTIAAMAVTGLSGSTAERMLIIDYMAVDAAQRGRGLGRQFLESLCNWAVKEHHIHAVLIEVEADNTEENAARVRFWEHCGFIGTSYVHQYIWLPEPYRAMVLPLSRDFAVSDDGQALFRHITSFHMKSFRKSRG